MSENEEAKQTKPNWVKMKPKEMEEIIISLHKEGNSPNQIGTILRDKHGIPKAKLFGKRISKILAENNLNVKSEKSFLEEKIKAIEAHILKNKHDYTAKKSLSKKQWTIRKLKN